MNSSSRKTTPPASSNTSYGCLFVFGLPFATIGTFLLVTALLTVRRSIETLSWVEVPAIISEATLQSSKDSHGEYSYTARIVYQYEYEGKRYTSSQISVEIFKDNASQQKIYEELSQYRNRQEPFRCYVNPKTPEQALLYRAARLGSVSSLLGTAMIFGVVGYTLSITMLVLFVIALSRKRFIRQHPHSPWLHRLDWKNRRIRSNSGGSLFVATTAACISCIFAFPILALIIYRERLALSGSVSVMSIIMILAALLLSWNAIRRFFIWRVSRQTMFAITTLPAVPGQSLRGTFHGPSTLKSGTSVTLTLECRGLRMQSEGSSASVSTETLWKGESTVKAQRGERGRSVVPVDIEIPAELPSSGAAGNTHNAIWQLTAHTASFSAVFDVPVFGSKIEQSEDEDFDTAESDETTDSDDTADSDGTAESDD